MKAINFGIDLGTTNSLITKYENGKVTIFKNPIGHKETLASVVAFRPDRTLVGDKAREFINKDAINIFSNFKRRMGTDDKFYVVNIDENVTPVELSTYVLKELKQFVHTGEQVEAAVITIPASFDTMQSNATKKAGLAAGFKEVLLLQEPIAASLAYFNNNEPGDEKEGYWLVYDLGGGTFDIALMQIKDGEMKVVDHEGNNFLGGSDFDLSILETIVVPFVTEHLGITDFEEEITAKNGKYEKLFYELSYKAEEAKKELSYSNETYIDFTIDSKDLSLKITKDAFEKGISGRIAETLNMLRAILNRNDIHAQDIEEILLVGGSTFIPYVKQQLASETNIKINSSIDPTTAVAIGAAYYAANKYYKPAERLNFDEGIDILLSNIKSSNTESYNTALPDVTVQLSYSKMSKDDEEIIIAKTNGNWENKFYRIIRSDGGFDTGLVPLKSKFTEFVPLVTNLNNVFELRLFDKNRNEISSEEIKITNGLFNISGQPIPQDICIEIDDRENKTTKLEVIFAKNTILPQKKTLYREISKTIKRGDNESIIINILEGDRYARPMSNLAIACIEISGKDISSDIIKGSDIEIQITMSDNRELSTEVFLVMTQQEFKNAFSISEKHVSVARLKEQFIDLENEIRNSAKTFRNDENDTNTLQVESFLKELTEHKYDIIKLKENDITDKKYVLAEMLNRLSKTFDKLGGESRLESLRIKFLNAKEKVENHIGMADFQKEELLETFNKMKASEHLLLKSKNPAILETATEKMNNLFENIRLNTLSYIISRYANLKAMPSHKFRDYEGVLLIFKSADSALQNNHHHEFRQHFYNLLGLIESEFAYLPSKKADFKGTGIG